MHTTHTALIITFVSALCLGACSDDDPAPVTTGTGGAGGATVSATSSGGAATATTATGMGGSTTSSSGGSSTGSGAASGACGEITLGPDDPFTIDFGGDASPFPFDPSNGGLTNCILTGAGFNGEFFDLSIGTFTVTIGTLALGQNHLEPGVTVTASDGASITVQYESDDIEARSMDVGTFELVSGDGSTDDPYVGCLSGVTTLTGFGNSGGLVATMPAAVPVVCRRPGQ